MEDNKVNENKEAKQKAALKRDLLNLVKKVLFIFVFCFIVFVFIFNFYAITGENMYPNFKDTDLTLVFKLDKSYNTGDVVLIKKDGEKYLLRIIGKPGETITFNNIGEVIINDEILEEDYIFFNTYRSDNLKYPVTLQADEYFVLGDKRIASTDSRDFGVITKDDIVGKVIYVFRNRNM